MTPRVVATDLDGTVVRSDGSISARTRAALAAAETAGAMVVIVTGRPPRWLAGIAEATGHHGLAICANGALVYDLRAERVLESHLLEGEAAVRLLADLRGAIPGLGLAVEAARGLASQPGYVPRWTTDPDTVVAPIDSLLSEPLANLLGRHEDLG